eukprot:1599006-Rhodomonas_salina.1
MAVGRTGSTRADSRRLYRTGALYGRIAPYHTLVPHTMPCVSTAWVVGAASTIRYLSTTRHTPPQDRTAV